MSAKRIYIPMVRHFFTRFRVPLLLCATVVLLGSVISSRAAADTAQQKDGRMVTIHDRGTEKVVITKGKTIADALEKADVAVSNLDSVEPALDTELVAKNYQVNVYRARPVTIIDDESRIKVMTAHQSATKITAQANVTLYDEDTTQINRVEDIMNGGGAGLQLVIDRATAFDVKLYGKQMVMRTQAATVGEMFEEKDIKLAAEDAASLPLTTPITAGLKLEVWRNGSQTMSQEEPVAFETEQVQDADQKVGYKAIRTPGEAGQKTVTYEIVMKNGIEESRKVIQTVVTKQPKKQVEVVGTKPDFDGDFAAALAKLRSCEGGYNSYNPAGPYWGAYQFDASTWASAAPAGAEYGKATPAEQDQAARNLYMRRGWSPWPVCGASLPDIYR